MNRLLSTLLIVIIFSACHRQTQKTLPIQAVPIDAALILQSNDVKVSIEELAQNKPWKILSHETSLKNHVEELLFIDSILSTYGVDLKSVNPVFLSLHLTGAQSFDWLAITATENQEQKLQLLELSLDRFSSTIEHPYSNATIVEINTDEKKIFYTIHKDLLFLSPKKILVEDAIRQLKTPNNLTADKSFRRIYDSSNKKEDFNLFINAKNFDKLSLGILKKSSEAKKIAEWFQWDIDLLDEGILMSGISLSHDSLSQELSFYRGNPGSEPIAPSVLPINTGIFIRKSFENFKQYQRKLIHAIEYKHQKNNYESRIKPLSPEHKEAFENWIDSEITWFLVENSHQLNSGLVIHITDSEQVEDYISEQSDSTFDYREKKIFKWDQLKYMVSLSNFTEVKELVYACIIKDQLILSDDKGSLKSLINDYKAKRTLKNTSSYQNCLDKLGSRSNYTTYIQNPSVINLSQHYLEDELSGFLNLNAETLTGFKSLAIQFSAEGNDCYTNAYLHFDSSESEDTRSLWTSQLEAPILSEINIVKNHYNQKKEIVVQDELLNLYLISTEGKILWKRKLPEAILGKIQQIDLFKNKKLQLLFNSSSKIFLIDRKGRDVASYPIHLKRKTNLPLSLFDYEKNRNYRILISSGKHHYMYNKQGTIVKGWGLKETKSNAMHSAEHFVVGGKDYILLPEENGTLNILNRKGGRRIKVKQKIEFSENKLQILKGKNLAETRMVTIDKNGVQQNILFDGSIDKSIQFSFDKTVKYSYTNKHHIVVEGKDLKVNGPKINLIHNFKSENLTDVQLNKIGEQQYLSITDIQSSEAYLFRAPDDMTEGFPVYGTTNGVLEDIDLDGKLNYLIGGDSGMIYNYLVE
ncbi:MAG: hypothetical protein L7U70_06510 [Flavobacteriales bacterium]|nr:hypothetical protein [Flavobacteriales bacterium]